ncbi:hypothetical protein SAMN05216369_2398 [Marinobacter antarcticus]|uniref:Uncharacterized protein n=1 Tax=Marinobacter antarcticus TaxID=564117 RepID=A0A1M6TSS3_9GAMM|nr:hypothetical protein [Marinobacter antarcticus]SHK60052.1 hypothetical protein SAMN05216369_2398 [Marinobacter antarcticus]
MKLKTSLIRTAGVAILVTMASWPLAAQENEEVFGRELMTRTELQEHRDTLRNLNTDAERAQYRQKHHERMMQRAREYGVELKNGMGQGSGKGMGNGQGKGSGQGQGMGNGQGMGTGQGMGAGQGMSSGQGKGSGGNGKSQEYKIKGSGGGNQ